MRYDCYNASTLQEKQGCKAILTSWLKVFKKLMPIYGENGEKQHNKTKVGVRVRPAMLVALKTENQLHYKIG